MGRAQTLPGAKGNETCREKTTQLWPKEKRVVSAWSAADRGACRHRRCGVQTCAPGCRAPRRCPDWLRNLGREGLLAT
jgi:hypothetical protein